MAIVDLDTELAAPLHAVWRAVKTPKAFRTVTRSLLTMPAIKHREDERCESETVTGVGVSVRSYPVLPPHIARLEDRRGYLHTCRGAVCALVISNTPTSVARTRESADGGRTEVMTLSPSSAAAVHRILNR